MAGLESSLAQLVGVFKALGNLDPQSRIERVEIAQALQSLKEIAFFSSEVIELLETIESGSVFDKQFAQELSEYFSTLGEIGDSLRYLDPHRFARNTRITVEIAHTISDVYHGKLGIRRKLSQFFGSAAQARTARGAIKQEATRLLGQIARLNASIIEAETKLRAAHARAALKNEIGES